LLQDEELPFEDYHKGGELSHQHSPRITMSFRKSQISNIGKMHLAAADNFGQTKGKRRKINRTCCNIVATLDVRTNWTTVWSHA